MSTTREQIAEALALAYENVNALQTVATETEQTALLSALASYHQTQAIVLAIKDARVTQEYILTELRLLAEKKA